MLHLHDFKVVTVYTVDYTKRQAVIRLHSSIANNRSFCIFTIMPIIITSLILLNHICILLPHQSLYFLTLLGKLPF